MSKSKNDNSNSNSELIRVLRLSLNFYWPQFKNKGWPVQFDPIGGIPTQVYRTSRAMAKRNVTQTVLTQKLPNIENCWTLDESITVRGVRLTLLPLKSNIRGMVDLNTSWALGVIIYLIAKRSKIFDIVHVHVNGLIQPLLVGYIASKLLRAPLIVTVHCSILATYKSMGLLDRVLRSTNLAIERFVLDRSTYTIILTEATYKKLSLHGLVQKRNSSIISDTVDVEEFIKMSDSARQCEFRDRYPELQNKKIVTYVGRIAREKGWPRLIELMLLLDDPFIHLLICGDGSERAALEKAISDSKIKHRVTITGYLSLENVPPDMAISDVMVLVSNHEEFGGVMIEGMAVGTPTVAFSVGGIPSVQRDGITGILVESGDVAEMAKKVKILRENQQLHASVALSGLHHVKEFYGVQSAADRTLAVYQSVLQ